MLVAPGALLLAVKESCAFTQRAWLTATIVVGLLAFTALLPVSPPDAVRDPSQRAVTR